MKFLTRLFVLTSISSLSLSMNYAMAKTPAKTNHSTEMVTLMNDTLSSARSLVTMGNKIVTDGNSTGESERMIMGANMMITGLEMLSHYMEHNKMNTKSSSKSKDMTAPTPLSKDVISMITKMSDESAISIMKMGNKMVKEGYANFNAQKMIAGGEMLEKGMMIHHLGMMETHHH